MPYASRYGLLGFPIKHSLSPRMHNAAFAHLGLNAHYELFERKSSDVPSFFASLSQENIAGFNVTFPYKETVIALLDDISDDAHAIGAVNTVKVDGTKAIGYNTDGSGFLRHITEDLHFSPEHKRIILLGAGGAAKAIAIHLVQSHPASIRVYDVQSDRSAALCEQLAHKASCLVEQSQTVAGLQIERADLLINATPMGMKITDPLIVPVSLLHKELLVYDLIYAPAQTPLLAQAVAAGCRTSNGLGMLLYQGVNAFEIWTGLKAPISVMKEALLSNEA